MALRGPLRTAALSLAAFFAPTPSLSAEYVAHSSLGEFSCAEAGLSDVCRLYCDDDFLNTGYQFNCGSAGDCHFLCTNERCFRLGVLDASNALNLYFTSSASACPAKSVLNVPANGNATFTAEPVATFDSFKDRLDIRAGTNTQNIIVNCNAGGYDGCKRLIVDARTAQYVEINVGATSTLNGNINVDPSVDLPVADWTNTLWTAVRCPLNSSYSGPEAAPCVIDASSGGDIDALYVETTDGTPKDVVFKQNGGFFTNVVVGCTAGFDAVPFGVLDSGDTGKCDWTLPPTTTAPTTATRDPSKSPTRSPSNNPTSSPLTTASPSSFPSQTPSSFPSENPTAEPSALPSAAPSDPVTTDEDDQGEDIDPLESNGCMADSTQFILLICGIALGVCALIV